MVNHQQIQAINQTNGIDLQNMQQSSQVFNEPGISDNLVNQTGYEPTEVGAPVDTVIKQQVQSQQKIEQKQKQQVQQQQKQQQQQQHKQMQQNIQQQQQKKHNELQKLRDQQKRLQQQIARSKQQYQQQDQSGEENKQSMFSKYFVQTCFIIALIAGVVLYYLNQNGYLGKSSKPTPNNVKLSSNALNAAPRTTGGNLNNMFKYLFNN